MSGTAGMSDTTFRPRLIVIGSFALVFLFLIYPIITVVRDSLLVDGRISLKAYQDFLLSDYGARALLNSICLGAATVATTSLIGVPLGYFLFRYNFRGKFCVLFLNIMPLFVPSFITAVAFILLLGRSGTLNLILMDVLGLFKAPVNFLYGFHGVLLVETLHLYPIIMLSCMAALRRVEPALEEMAESLGASSLYRFLTITFPLIRPGYIAGAFMVFVYTLGDWITPVFLGSGAFLPAASYYNITQFIDERLYRMGLVAASLIITITVGLLILATRYVGLREYSSVLVSAASMREEGLHGWRKNVFVAGAMAVGLVATLPYISIVFGAFSKEWGLTPIPTAWGLERFTSILWAVRGSIINTVIFSVSATLITLVAGFLVAYLLARGSFPGKTLLDSTVTMMLAVPGLILGIGYLRAFREPIFGFPLTESVLVMIILLAARRVPFVIRSAYASLLQVSSTLEDAAEALGAKRVRIMITITAPLVFQGLLVGTLFSFIFIIQELSSTAFVYRAGWETIPIEILRYQQSGGGVFDASVLSLILIMVTMAAVLTTLVIGGRKTELYLAG